MDTEIAMLLSSGIAVGASLITFVLTKFFDARSEKRKEHENFFFMVFPKRMELYEDIIKATDFIASPRNIIDSESLQKLFDLLLEKCNELADIIYRCNTFGSIQVTGTLTLLYNLIDEFGKHTFHTMDFQAIKNAYVNSFLPKSLELRIKLITFIREESGTQLVDKKIYDFLKDTKMRKDKKKSVNKKG